MSEALGLARPKPVVLFCRADNKAMVALAKRAGALITPSGGQLHCRIDTDAIGNRERRAATTLAANAGLRALSRGTV